MNHLFSDMIRTSWLHYLAASVEAGRIKLDDASFLYDTICETLTMKGHENANASKP